jgi:hypothetical protein
VSNWRSYWQVESDDTDDSDDSDDEVDGRRAMTGTEMQV